MIKSLGFSCWQYIKWSCCISLCFFFGILLFPECWIAAEICQRAKSTISRASFSSPYLLFCCTLKRACVINIDKLSFWHILQRFFDISFKDLIFLPPDRLRNQLCSWWFWSTLKPPVITRALVVTRCRLSWSDMSRWKTNRFAINLKIKCSTLTHLYVM